MEKWSVSDTVAERSVHKCQDEEDRQQNRDLSTKELVPVVGDVRQKDELGKVLFEPHYHTLSHLPSQSEVSTILAPAGKGNGAKQTTETKL